jgi:predicted glutamine amidotransferase
MCGIVGLISTKILDTTHVNQFKKLLVMDQIRGKDSVGIISQQYAGVTYEKSVIDPVSFLEHRRVTPLLTGAKALIGHNRAATRGGISSNNAHPFNHGAITLVHNGTLRSNAVVTPHFTVDSESICYALSQKEPWEAQQVIESLEGAFALIWHDARDNSWNVAKNDERPLHYMNTIDKSLYWFSSEAGILYASTEQDMANLDPKKHIHMFPDNELWKIKPDAVTPLVLALEVATFTPKKRFPITLGQGTALATSHTGSGSSKGKIKKGAHTNTGHTTTNVKDFPKSKTGVTGAFPRALEAFQKHFGMPRWAELEVDTIGGNRAGMVMVSGWLASEPYSKVVIHNVPHGEVSVGDPIEVFISTLYHDSYGNARAIAISDMSSATLTATDWRKHTASSTDPVVCVNCSGVFLESECKPLNDGGHVCNACLDDKFVSDYFRDQLL